jgi:DNA-binding NarL/FixJ family response regulator
VRDGRYAVVIVDDHALFSQGLALLLESRAGETFTVVGSTTAGEEAVALVGREAADIAIVDLALPPLGGVETIRRIVAAYPATKVLALSGTDDLGLAAAALRAGASGFLGKSADPDVLVAPLLTIAAGVRVVRADLLDALLAAGWSASTTATCSCGRCWRAGWTRARSPVRCWSASARRSG